MHAYFDCPPVNNLMRALAEHPDTPRQCRFLKKLTPFSPEDAYTTVHYQRRADWECYTLTEFGYVAVEAFVSQPTLS